MRRISSKSRDVEPRPSLRLASSSSSCLDSPSCTGLIEKSGTPANAKPTVTIRLTSVPPPAHHPYHTDWGAVHHGVEMVKSSAAHYSESLPQSPHTTRQPHEADKARPRASFEAQPQGVDSRAFYFLRLRTERSLLCFSVLILDNTYIFRSRSRVSCWATRLGVFARQLIGYTDATP